jgi:hypothetical protein
MSTSSLPPTAKAPLAGAILFLVAACGTSPSPSANLSIPTDAGYVLTVPVQAGDTRESIAKQYSGEVVVWLQDKAILQISSEVKAALLDRGLSAQNTLEANMTLKNPEVQANGWNAWGSGWNAWGSGTTPPMPPSDNNAIWQQVRLRQAHSIGRNFGSGIKVALLDTGLDTTHPIFTGRLAPSTEWKDYVEGDTNPAEPASGSMRGHGTGVAGIIVQVAPKATILPIRVLNADGSGSLSQVVSGIYWAADRGVNVINLSLGSIDPSTTLYNALKYARDRGVYIVAAAGNKNTNGIEFPARYSKDAGLTGFLFGVSSVDSTYILSSFANYGTDLFMSAPGEKIVSAFPGSQVAQMTGTSFAAPLTTGIVAFVMSEMAPAQRGMVGHYLERASLRGDESIGTSIKELNLQHRGTDEIGKGILDTEGTLLVLPGFTPRVAPVRSHGSNLSFESDLSGWTERHASSSWIVNNNFRSGSRALAINGYAEVVTTISGLKANTNYVASVWVRPTSTSVDTYAGVAVENFDNSGKLGTNRYVGLSSRVIGTTYTKVSVPFTTGSNTSVIVQLYADGATTYLDDVALVEAGY